MAINYSYPTASPSLGDLITFSKILEEDGMITKTTTISDLLQLGTGEIGPQGPAGPAGPFGSPNYLEFSAKLDQSDATPPEVYGSYIDEISIGNSIEDPLYRGYISTRISTGVYRVGFEWVIGSASEITAGKLELTMAGGPINVIAESTYSSVGFVAGYRFTIEVRDNDNVLSDDVLGSLYLADIRFRLFN